MRDEQEAANGISGQIEKLRRRMLDPDELAGAVEAFDPLWDSLSPAHKAKLVHLLVDRIIYDGEGQSVSITFHETGIRSFIGSDEEVACKAK